MSFAFTTQDEIRVSLASLLGIKDDPIGYHDLAAICVWASIYAIQLLAVLYTLWNRKYPPVQTCRPILMAVFIASGVLWFVGDIVTNSMVHMSKPPLTNCILIIVWLRSALGQNAQFFLLQYRCISLFVEYRLKLTMTKTMAASFGAFLLVCDFLPAIIASVFPREKTILYIPVLEYCQFNDSFKIAMMTLAWLNLGNLVFAAAVLIATVQCAHKEQMRIGVACIPLIIATCFHSVIFFRKPLYPSSLAWRLAVVSIEQASVICAWWSVMGAAVYHCAFRNKIHLHEWKKASAKSNHRIPASRNL